jgi:glycosyltransferase involved in cell wall biosynthesis
MSEPAAPAVSVVVPLFNEEGNVVPLCGEVIDVLQELGTDFEIICVNDGSRDGTLAKLRMLCEQEPRLRILDLDGNFGEAAALCAGFHAARGAHVVTLDGDGQNDPRDIPRLFAPLREPGRRVVSGWRQQRQESTLLRVLPSRIANFLIAAVTRIRLHDCGCGLKAYDHAVLGTIHLPRGMHRFLPAILGVRSSEVAEVTVTDRHRLHGESHYGIGRALIVIRDLFALPFLIANPRLFESIVGVSTLSAAAAALVSSAPVVVITSGALAVLAGLVWWNLRRFNRAQRDGVYRLRQEYP